MNVSLSTMWWGESSPESLASLARRTRRLGFEQIELNYRLSEMALPSLGEALRQAGLTVSSVHAPFPRPYGPNPLGQLDLGSPEPAFRERAEVLALRSLEEAARWGAGAVVLHAGNLETLGSLEARLHDLYREKTKPNGRHGVEEAYRRLWEELRLRREAEAPRFLERVRDSLGRLAVRAQSLGVTIGLENRAHYAEQPSLEEMGPLLDEWGPAVGYWHDVGHAYRLDALGYCRQEAWLERYATHLVGMHLHDSIGMEDHRPPGQGNARLDEVASLLPEKALRVVEVRPGHDEQAVSAGLARLVALGVLP
jgi:sugar phosphate isomerase/epimerase